MKYLPNFYESDVLIIVPERFLPLRRCFRKFEGKSCNTGMTMRRNNYRTAGAPDIALVISRQIRRAENMRYLNGLPGFELRRELPAKWHDLLRKLQEAEKSTSRHGNATAGSARGR